MMDLMKLLMEKKGKGKKLPNLLKEAKMSVLQSLSSKAEDEMGGKLQKVVVAAKDKNGLKKGLELAEKKIGGSSEKIKGGLGDGKSDEEFDPEELKEGIEEEMEHTTDPEIAKEIAKDHLSEMADYYTRLEEMEEGNETGEEDEDSYEDMYGEEDEDTEEEPGDFEAKIKKLEEELARLKAMR